MSHFFRANEIEHHYGTVKILQGCSFDLREGEIVSLLGESGSGKTTMLRIIAGFERPSAGKISIRETVLADQRSFVIPEQRRIGMVFQDYALFPHLSVLENIAIGQPKNAARTAKAWLEAVGLSGMGDRRPDQLSGGQQQRVAIARALAAVPQMLLLDEPFSNIDESLKFGFRHELQQLLRKQNIPAIFVTHDTKDAMAIADRVVILKDGEVRQIGTPQEIYQQPADRYVAGLLGPYNVISETDDRCQIIRAENVHVDASESMITATVDDCMFQGQHFLVHLTGDDKQKWIARSTEPVQSGSTVGISYASKDLIEVKNR